jgi:hypothetical protein
MKRVAQFHRAPAVEFQPCTVDAIKLVEKRTHGFSALPRQSHIVLGAPFRIRVANDFESQIMQTRVVQSLAKRRKRQGAVVGEPGRIEVEIYGQIDLRRGLGRRSRVDRDAAIQKRARERRLRLWQE